MEEITSKVLDINSIKSEYNIKEIFSFLSRKQIYNLIIYNKHLQKLVEINIKK